jgi:hypothetical protein
MDVPTDLQTLGRAFLAALVARLGMTERQLCCFHSLQK